MNDKPIDYEALVKQLGGAIEPGSEIDELVRQSGGTLEPETWQPPEFVDKPGGVIPPPTPAERVRTAIETSEPGRALRGAALGLFKGFGFPQTTSPVENITAIPRGLWDTAKSAVKLTPVGPLATGAENARRFWFEGTPTGELADPLATPAHEARTLFQPNIELAKSAWQTAQQPGIAAKLNAIRKFGRAAIPLVGPQLAAADEQLAQAIRTGDTERGAEALGEYVGTAAALGAGERLARGGFPRKIAEKAIGKRALQAGERAVEKVSLTPGSEEALLRVVRPPRKSAESFRSALLDIRDDLLSAESEARVANPNSKIRNLATLRAAAVHARDRLLGEYQKIRDQYGASRYVDNQQVANAIRKEISPTMRRDAAIDPTTGTPINPEAAKRVEIINGLADRWERSAPRTFQEAAQDLEYYNGELAAYYANQANPMVAKGAQAARYDPKTLGLTAIADNLRTQLGQGLTQASGKAVFDLKRRIGSAMEVLEHLDNAVNRELVRGQGGVGDYYFSYIAGRTALDLLRGEYIPAARGAAEIGATLLTRILRKPDTLVENAFDRWRAAGYKPSQLQIAPPAKPQRPTPVPPTRQLPSAEVNIPPEVTAARQRTGRQIGNFVQTPSVGPIWARGITVETPAVKPPRTSGTGAGRSAWQRQRLYPTPEERGFAEMFSSQTNTPLDDTIREAIRIKGERLGANAEEIEQAINEYLTWLKLPPGQRGGLPFNTETPK